jgi:hypothetical protein
MPHIRLMNCFWLLVPVLGWNLVLTSRLTQEGFRSDQKVASWILGPEGVLRIVVFAYPLLLPLQAMSEASRAGVAVYVLGLVVYCGSWIPLLRSPDTKWSRAAIGLLAPYLSPLFIFAGIALIGNSGLYLVLSAFFVAMHTLHGVQSHGILTTENGT